MARPIGLVLQRIEGDATSFQKSIHSTASRLSKTELYIPTREADMMGFGILPGCEEIGRVLQTLRLDQKVITR